MIDVANWVGHASQRLYGIDSALKAIAYAWNSQTNLLMYGPGGYAKSHCATMFGEYLKAKGEISTGVFVKSFHLGTSEDEILGGIDVKRFKDEGELRHLIQKCFIQHEYVIFEEALNMDVRTMGVINDILTSGFVRNGDEDTWEPIKTRLIVICTNKTREEVAIDASTTATLDRFPMEVEVKWSTHTFEDYRAALSLAPEAKDNEYYVDFAAKAADLYHVNDKTAPNPRAVYYAMRSMIMTQSTQSIEFFPMLGKYRQRVEEHLGVVLQQRVLKSADQSMASWLKTFKKNKVSNISIKTLLTFTKETLSCFFMSVRELSLRESVFKDELFDLKNKTINDAKEAINKVFEVAAESIIDADQGSEEWLIASYRPAMIHSLIRDVVDGNIANPIVSTFFDQSLVNPNAMKVIKQIKALR